MARRYPEYHGKWRQKDVEIFGRGLHPGVDQDRLKKKKITRLVIHFWCQQVL